MTNLERIRAMDAAKLAERIFDFTDDVMDKICKTFCPCPFGDEPERENCIACAVRWLKEEIQ